MLSKSLTKGCVCVCVCVCVYGCVWVLVEVLLYYGGGFTLKGVMFCWDIKENYATESTFAECVKRLCLGCVDELSGG